MANRTNVSCLLSVWPTTISLVSFMYQPVSHKRSWLRDLKYESPLKMYSAVKYMRPIARNIYSFSFIWYKSLRDLTSTPTRLFLHSWSSVASRVVHVVCWLLVAPFRGQQMRYIVTKILCKRKERWYDPLYPSVHIFVEREHHFVWRIDITCFPDSSCACSK